MTSYLIATVAIIWAIFQLIFTSFGVLDAMTLRATHIIFIIILIFLIYPTFTGFKGQKYSFNLQILNFIGLALGVFAFGYLIINYPTITMRGGYFSTFDTCVAALALFISFELARRVVPNMAVLALIFFGYNFVGQYFDGVFGHSVLSFKRVVDHLFWGSQGILGVGVGLSSTYLFTFMLFGVFLKNSGFSDFLTDLAQSLVGRTVGGPAKVAVVASAFMGMVNGSAIANVATTGLITIPLMKKNGYQAEFAAAVEAVASTGGQFAPPIMGAVGFLMAEFLGVPYTTVMLAAIIPAFLYYLTLICAVHFEAKKLGLSGLALENIPPAWNLMKAKGHLFIPLIVLLVMLFMGYTPLFSSVLALLSTILAANLRSSTRMSFKQVMLTLQEGAISALSVSVACIIIGVIIGTVSLTGVGISFGYAVLGFVGEGDLYLAAILVMIMSTILGLGVPGIAAYVIISAVSVPVLIDLGVLPIAAHLFCLYYACLSNITPPVAMASYVAAGIAGANETKTSLIAMKLGLTGFLLPFYFLENTLLLYNSSHSLPATLWAIISASIGVIALASSLEGYLLRPCTYLLRLVLFVIAILAIHPNVLSDFLAIFVLLAILYYQSSRSSRV